MKEISISKKHKVIKLFFGGLSYDEIAAQVGIAKGSVVNIIDDFRGGSLPIPVNMTEYMDELRHLVVDMRKHNTTVNQLKSYNKLHKKLGEMGVDIEQVDQWLDICQDIATTTVSNSEFASAALQLAQLKAETGYDPESLIHDFKTKHETVKVLDTQIDQQKAELAEIQQKTKEEKEQAAKELESITKATTTAQENFTKQKTQLKLQLDEYLIQNQLSWDKVNKISAILHSELSKAGLDQDEEEMISQEIAEVGSLTVSRKKLEKENKELQASNDQLVAKNKQLTNNVTWMKSTSQQLAGQLGGEIAAKTNMRNELDAQLEPRRAELTQLEELISDYALDLYVCRLVLGFLIATDLLNDHDFDQIAKLLLALRQIRLGVTPMRVVDAKGNVVCHCPVPTQYIPFNQYGVSIDKAKEKLALYLVPLVKDKFVPKFEYEAAQISQSMIKLHKQLLDLQLQSAGVFGSTKVSK